MRDIDQISIRLFLATLEEGSIAKAAARENIVPSAVSKRISEMEAELRVLLLDRSVKGVHPTPAGEALALHARSLLQGMERMRREMAGHVEGVRGHIRVAASVASLSGDLPADIQTFRRAHPQIEVVLEERMTPAVFRAVLEGTSDIGIASDFGNHDGLQVLPYRSYELAAVVPARHALAHEPSLTYAQLLPYEQVELSRESGISLAFEHAAHEARQTRRISANVNSHETICALVARGMGVGVVPHYLKKTQERSLDVRFVPLTDAWARPRICMVVRDNHVMASAAQAFMSHLRLRSDGADYTP